MSEDVRERLLSLYSEIMLDQQALLAKRRVLATAETYAAGRLRDCLAAARLFGIELPEHGALRPDRTLSELLLDQLMHLGEATARQLNDYIATVHRRSVHAKSVGVALLRMSKHGLVHRRGTRLWVYGPAPSPQQEQTK